VRTLTRRELNRALLARQLLLERGSPQLPEALERVGGIQAQYAPSMYVGLWSRVDGFERGMLDAALERRAVVQATLMRVTIHLVSRADYWPFALATRAARRARWLSAVPDAPSAAAMAGAARTLRRRLAQAGTLRRTEIEALVGKPRAHGVGLWLDLVRVPPAGTWERRRADVYGAAEDWIGPPDTTVRAATEHLVRRYLGGFGPASAKDVASFTGLTVTVLEPALAALELRRFRGEDGEELLDLPDAPLPDAETPAPPRFLPTWDATLLVHARRTGLLPEEHRPKLFSTKTPQSFPTFLVDGAVAGRWRHERGRVELEPFGRLDAATRRALDAEAGRLAAFHA
jgi:Winged helix DNA-binding domain